MPKIGLVGRVFTLGGIDINERIHIKPHSIALSSTTVSTRSLLCMGFYIAVDISVAREQISLLVHVWQLQHVGDR